VADIDEGESESRRGGGWRRLAEARKNKDEDSVNDKLTAMVATIEQLMATPREITEHLGQFSCPIKL
jgi:hypothetical protein